jgi:hypothetical protein
VVDEVEEDVVGADVAVLVRVSMASPFFFPSVSSFSTSILASA